MAEGKTLAPTAPCQLCDEDDSIKFCTDCRQDLCSRCSRAHGKIQSTSLHKLIRIQDKGSIPKKSQAFCSYHTSKQLSVICEQCLCALCDVCADKEHNNHKLLRSNLNPDLLHRICAQKVPEFMQLLQQLKKEKDGSPIKLQLYKTARDMVKTWRGHLWKIIEDESDELLKQIEKEIEKQESLLAVISSNLKDLINTTDQKMIALSNARTMSETGALLANIQESDDIIKNGKSLLDEIESTRKAYTIDDLLPFRNELNSVEKSLHTCFTMTPLADGNSIPKSPIANLRQGKTEVAQRRSYQQMSKIYSNHIGKIGSNYFPLSGTNYFRLSGTNYFRISEHSESDSKTVVIYHVDNKTVHVFDKDFKQQKQFVCTKLIQRMISLSDDRHVMIENETLNIHLLDGNFCIISTLKNDRSSKFTPRGMCPMLTDTFMITECCSRNKSRVCEVNVLTTNQLSRRIVCEVNVENLMGVISLHRDLKHLTYITSLHTIHTVNLTTGQLTKVDLVQQMSRGYLNIVSVDESDRILIGDSDGKIHLVHAGKYDRELQNMKGAGIVGGISVRGDNVVTVVGEDITMYK